jgi:FtsP/CotA-like multicopper oxidase with cupredoxin domain
MLSQSTAIHFHGRELPNDQDDVPFITQAPVKPGESYTDEFHRPETQARTSTPRTMTRRSRSEAGFWVPSSSSPDARGRRIGWC